MSLCLLWYGQTGEEVQCGSVVRALMSCGVASEEVGVRFFVVPRPACVVC